MIAVVNTCTLPVKGIEQEEYQTYTNMCVSEGFKAQLHGKGHVVPTDVFESVN